MTACVRARIVFYIVRVGGVAGHLESVREILRTIEIYHWPIEHDELESYTAEVGDHHVACEKQRVNLKISHVSEPRIRFVLPKTLRPVNTSRVEFEIGA